MAVDAAKRRVRRGKMSRHGPVGSAIVGELCPHRRHDRVSIGRMPLMPLIRGRVQELVALLELTPGVQEDAGVGAHGRGQGGDVADEFDGAVEQAQQLLGVDHPGVVEGAAQGAEHEHVAELRVGCAEDVGDDGAGAETVKGSGALDGGVDALEAHGDDILALAHAVDELVGVVVVRRRVLGLEEMMQERSVHNISRAIVFGSEPRVIDVRGQNVVVVPFDLLG